MSIDFGPKGSVAALTAAEGQSASLHNYRPENYLRTRAAINKVRSGSGDAYIAWGPADSGARGTGSHVGPGRASGTQGYNGCANMLATLLTLRGVKTQSETVFCAGGYEGNFPTFDDRISVSSAGVVIGTPSVGGKLFQFGNAGWLEVAFKTPVAKADVWYFGQSAGGSFTPSVDGVALGGNVSAVNATAGVYKTTINLGMLATHTLRLTGATANNCTIIGIDAYDDSSPLLHLWNFAWHGSRTSQWTTDQATTSAWFARNAIPGYLKPALCILGPICANDFSTTNNVPIDVSRSNMQDMISFIKPQSDILLVTPNPRGDAVAPSSTTQAAFNQMFYDLAVANDLAVVDEYASFGKDQAVAEALGFYTTDHAHRNATGHMASAQAITSAILKLAQAA